MNEYERTSCRVCGEKLGESILDLGPQLVSDFPDTYAKEMEETVGPTRVVPLDLCTCTDCGLAQLRHTSPRDWHYKGDYWYRSSINESMVAALDDLARDALSTVGLRPGDAILDIGANDGTLLQHFLYHVARGVQLWAIEPAPQFAEDLDGVADVYVQNYYPIDIDVKAKVITSAAMFYDLDNPHAFVESIKKNLHRDGVWVVQFTDLQATLEMTDVGNICHEHLCYYQLYPFERLLHDHGLGLYDVKRNHVNGGSVRATVIHRGTQLERPSVEAMRQDQFISCGRGKILEFRRSVERVHEAFFQLRASLREEGCKVWDVYGASTKGNTLLQWLRLGPDVIRQAIERSEAKWGRFTVNGIPIVSEEEARRSPADVGLVLPWHFRDGIIKREEGYLSNGGKLLFPLPFPEVVSGRQS